MKLDTTFLDEVSDFREGHGVATDKTVTSFKKVYDLVKPKKVIEIGFNAGHSAFIGLSICDTIEKYVSVDIGKHKYTRTNANKMIDLFPNTFVYKEIDSKKLSHSKVSKEGYDLAFIDGDHSLKGLTADIDTMAKAKIPYILIDDFDRENFTHIVKYVHSIENTAKFPYTTVFEIEYDSYTSMLPEVLVPAGAILMKRHNA